MNEKEQQSQQELLENLADLSQDQQIDILVTALSEFCDRMDASSVDAEALTASLFIMFQERMCDLGDREGFEEMLATALEEPWPEHWLH